MPDAPQTDPSAVIIQLQQQRNTAFDAAAIMGARLAHTEELLRQALASNEQVKRAEIKEARRTRRQKTPDSPELPVTE